MRQLDLQLSFARPRAARKDVENQLCAVDNLSPDFLLDLAQLGRCQLVVDNDEVGADFGARGSEHRDLTFAEERRRIRFRPLLQHAQDDVRARRVSQPAELVERSLGVESMRATRDQPDERRALASRYARRVHA